MRTRNTPGVSRRMLILGARAAVLFAPSVHRAQEAGIAERNTSSYRTHYWRDHFDNLGSGINIPDSATKALRHWMHDGEIRIHPTSVSLSDALMRRGSTEVPEKRKNPSWAPTASMRERIVEWPARISGGGPSYPLGTRVPDLSRPSYRIHGTRNTRKVGPHSSNGCIGLYNERIEKVFDRVPVGTKVKII